MRAIIERGDAPGVVLQTVQNGSQISQGLKDALEALEAGEGVKAFEEYTLIESRGYNNAFSTFGKAMCCTLERDAGGARSFLSLLELRPATPMAVNMCALRCVLDIFEGENIVEAEKTLIEALEILPNYSFQLSHLRPLSLGIQKRNYPEIQEINRIFSKLGAT